MSGNANAGVMARQDLIGRQMSAGVAQAAQPSAQRAPQQSGNGAAGVMAREDLIGRQMGTRAAQAARLDATAAAAAAHAANDADAHANAAAAAGGDDGVAQQAAQQAFDQQFQQRYSGAVPLDRQAFQQAFDRGYARDFEYFDRSVREGFNYFVVQAGIAGAECAQSALALQASQQAPGPQQQQAAQAGGSDYRVSTPEAEFYNSDSE